MREPRSAPSTETSPRKMLYTRWKGGRTEGELPTVKLTEATWHKLEHNEQSSNAVTGGAVSHEELISDDFKHHEAIVRRGTIVMERLYKLARKGYKPDFDMEFTKSISLRHSSLKIRWPHDKLILFPDGLLVSLHDTDKYRFAAWHKEEFEQFLEMVPKPTLFDKASDFRSRVAAWIFIAIFVGGFAIVGGLMGAYITGLF